MNQQKTFDKVSVTGYIINKRTTQFSLTPQSQDNYMTNKEYQQIHRYRLTCEINTLNAILQKGELDVKHTRHVQQSIAFLTAQLNATVKK